MRQWQLRMKRITDAFAGTNYPSHLDRIRGNAAGHAFLAANLYLFYNSGISASNLLAANERIDKIENWFSNLFTPRSEARLDRQADIFQDEYNNLVGLVWASCKWGHTLFLGRFTHAPPPSPSPKQLLDIRQLQLHVSRPPVIALP